MNNKADKSAKNQHPKTYLFIAIVWLALGLFGLIFDPSKSLIIISQFVLGAIILIYYLWLKFSS